jgi:transposase
MEGKAEVSGKSIRLGTLKFPMPVRITLNAARIGLWSAFVLATSMNGVLGNTARNVLKTAPSIQNNDSRRELRREVPSSPFRRAPAREFRIILDHLSAHQSRVVRDFLAAHRNVHFDFTPTYSSWLNQVEIRFSQVERDVIARGIFTSVKDLARKLRRYINAYSASAKPIQWKYSDPTRRIRDNIVSATCR